MHVMSENVAVQTRKLTVQGKQAAEALPPQPCGSDAPRRAGRRHGVPLTCSYGACFSSSCAVFEVRVLGVEPDARWYNVRLRCRLRPEFCWQVTRRYSDFAKIASHLSKEDDGASIAVLPPKLPLVMLSPAHRQRRVLGLQRFCQHLLAQPRLASDNRVAAFFDLDFGYFFAAL